MNWNAFMCGVVGAVLFASMWLTIDGISEAYDRDIRRAEMRATDTCMAEIRRRLDADQEQLHNILEKAEPND